MMETTNTNEASPTLFGRCYVLHCSDGESVFWRDLLDRWLGDARQKWVLNSASEQLMHTLITFLFSNFLQNGTRSSWSHCLFENATPNFKRNNVTNLGIFEITCYTSLLGAIFDKFLSRKHWEKISEEDVAKRKPEDIIPNYLLLLRNLIAFAFTWSIGGSLNANYWGSFNTEFRKMLTLAPVSIDIPEEGSVFDYCVNTSGGGEWIKWKQTTADKTGNYVFTSTVERCSYLAEIFLQSNKPILITGENGCGKSSLVNKTIAPKFHLTPFMINPLFESKSFQDQLSAHVNELYSKQVAARRTKLHQSPADKVTFFIEDLHLAIETIPEMLRQAICEKRVYSVHRRRPVDFHIAHFILSTSFSGASGYGKTTMLNSRFVRHLNIINLSQPTKEDLTFIFGRRVLCWLEDFPTYSVPNVSKLARALVQSSVEVYEEVRRRFRPTPLTPHYIFTSQNLYDVINGMILFTPRPRMPRLSVGSGSAATGSCVRSIIRLWIHENHRIFSDRFFDKADRHWFDEIVEQSLSKYFCSPVESEEFNQPMAAIPEGLSTSSEEEEEDEEDDNDLPEPSPASVRQTTKTLSKQESSSRNLSKLKATTSVEYSRNDDSSITSDSEETAYSQPTSCSSSTTLFENTDEEMRRAGNFFIIQ